MEFGPYQLVRKIGSGGMGEVWLAQHINANTGASRTVALKRLPPKLAHQERFRRVLLEEARLSMMLSHSNIVHVFDAGEIEGEAYISMEFVDGEDLSRLLRRLGREGRRLAPTMVAFIIAEVLQALSYAHELSDEHGGTYSLVHRDISPHNIMLSASGEVKLTDFGVARLSSEDTSGTHVKGKIRYMPPEQLRGESRSPLVDLFATGAVFQELLDGELFRGSAVEDAALLGMVMDGVVPGPRDPLEIPPELDQVRAGLLQPDPRQRLPSARVALRRLYAWSEFRNSSLAIGKLVGEHRTPPEGHPESGPRLAAAPTDLDTRPSLSRAAGLVGSVGRRYSGPRPGSPQPSFPPPPRRAVPLDPIDPFPPLAASPGASDSPTRQLDSMLGDLSLLEAPRRRAAPTPTPTPSPVPIDLDSISLEQPDESAPVTLEDPDPDAPFRPSSQSDSRTNSPRKSSGPPPHIEPALDPAPGPRAPSTAPAELQLDLDVVGGRLEVASSRRPRRPTAPTPERRGPRRGLRAVAALTTILGGLGGAAYLNRDALSDLSTRLPGSRPHSPPEELDSTRALVLGDLSPAYMGFRHQDMQTALADAGFDYRFAARHSYGEPLATLAGGEAEFVVTTLDQVLRERPAGKIVAVVDTSIGGEALVLDTVEFPELSDLAGIDTSAGGVLAESGASLALVGGTTSEYLAHALGSLGLIPPFGPALGAGHLHIDRDFSDPAVIWESLVASEVVGPPVVGAILREPWVRYAHDAGMRVVFSSRDLPYAIVSVLVASDRVLESNPALVEDVVAAYYRRVAAQQDDQPALLAQIVRQSDLDLDQAGHTLAGTCIFDLFGAEPWLVPDGERAPLLGRSLAEVWSTLEAAGQTRGPPPPLAQLIDARPLRAALAAALPEVRDQATDDHLGDLDSCLARPGSLVEGTELGDLRLPLLPSDESQASSWFGAGSADLDPGAESVLDALAQRLANLDTVTIRAQIHAYADLDSPAQSARRRLAKRRAQAIVASLRERGVDMKLSAHAEVGAGPPTQLRVHLRRR